MCVMLDVVVVNLWLMREAATFSFKRSKCEYFSGPAGSHYSWESNMRNKQEKRVACRHNKNVQEGTDHRLWTLEPCGKLGKWGCHPSQFPLPKKSHSSCGRDWSQIKENSKLDTVIHFICNLSLISEKKHSGDVCRCIFKYWPAFFPFKRLVTSLWTHASF